MRKIVFTFSLYSLNLYSIFMGTGSLDLLTPHSYHYLVKYSQKNKTDFRTRISIASEKYNTFSINYDYKKY